jgi:hypothetical protein
MNLATWLLDLRLKDDSRDPTNSLRAQKNRPAKGFGASLKTNRRTISLTLQKEGKHMSLTYTLVRECLNNVNDVAGLWQIEGGKVMEKDNQVANYSSVKRVSCGTTEQNTAMLWITLFFIKAKPPENITLHGAHDFNSGGEIGSVSAASSAFAGHIGKQFKRVVNTLTIA